MRLDRTSLTLAVVLCFVNLTVASAQPPVLRGGKPGALAESPFPSELMKDVKWLDSLPAGIKSAGASGKPICLVIAGQRPFGNC